MIDTLGIYNYLVERHLDFFAGVLDSSLAHLTACIADRSPMDHNVIAVNEGSAVAIAVG